MRREGRRPVIRRPTARSALKSQISNLKCGRRTTALHMIRLSLLTFVWAAAAAVTAGAADAPDYDLVIRHGRIIDGTGTPARAGDVAIRDGRIVAVGAVVGTARSEIDATGKVVAPGFIDVHTHAEELKDLPIAENYIRMGVTTIVTGNCGFSGVNVAQYFDEVSSTGIALNVAALIGQGAVRAQVMGGSFMRPATAAELDQMRQLVAQAMKDGAVGLSTGLIYLPGTYTKTEEIIELAKVAAAAGGIYASHMRYEGYRIFEALDELIRIAREAKIPAEVSHIKLSGPTAWGQTDKVVAVLNRARVEGLKITQDQYAYTASSTGIATLVPSDVREGGDEQFRARLADPARKARMIATMKQSVLTEKRGDFSYAVIASYAHDPELNGKSIAQAAKLRRGSDSIDYQIEIIFEIVANGGAAGVFHGMSEADLQKFMVLPETMIASDGAPRKFGDGVPHPRGYGNNARVLGRYVRELHLLTLEDAVRKMTSLPAQTFQLARRGKLAPDAVADLVVFDPAKVSDPATYDDPHHYATGFSDVIVNGVPVIRAGELTPARPGRPVRLQDK
jgi:N-acyl-D-amino-acid deacylase